MQGYAWGCMSTPCRHARVEVSATIRAPREPAEHAGEYSGVMRSGRSVLAWNAAAASRASVASRNGHPKDLTGTTAAGVHLAAMASVWQALALGFCGLRAVRGELRIDPLLPQAWRSLTVPVQIAGCPVRITVEPGMVTVESTRRVTVRVGAAGTPHRVPPGGLRLRRSGRGGFEALL